jgi:hypothetical protein
MRFMVLLKANAASESGEMPSEDLLTEMMAYNERLVNAGVMVGGEGLHPSSKGARVKFSGDERSITDGTFAETKELLAGFWILKTESLEEAIDWVKQIPNPTGEETEVEIRQVVEMADFGDAATPELQAKDAELRAKESQSQ